MTTVPGKRYVDGIVDERDSMSGRSALVRRTGLIAVGTVIALAVSVGSVGASNVGVGLSEQSVGAAIPVWLSLAMGGGAVGTSVLMTVLITNREHVERFRTETVGVSVDRFRTSWRLVFGTVGVATLVLMLVVGVVGPQIGSFSITVLLTFVGGRALLTIVAYTVGNPWPALNPWRYIATALPNGYLSYPSWLGSWPAVGALLVLLCLEAIAPLTTSPRALVAVILAYSVFTIGGAVVFAPDSWFRNADPISAWFRFYSAVAPIQRTADGLEVRYPGARLTDDDVVSDISEIAFVLLLLWELTYSAVIATAPGVRTVETLVGIGLAPQFVYLGLLLVGFGLFWKGFLITVTSARCRAESPLSQREVAFRFASPLLAIAAGYHFAHYAGFSLSLWPSLVDTIAAPLNPPENPTQYLLTSWFGYVEIMGILFGYMLSVWVAHAVSFNLLSGKRRAIRCQYPFIAVMIVLTVVSLLLVTATPVEPVYVPS